jgi:hypothetical protein
VDAPVGLDGNDLPLPDASHEPASMARVERDAFGVERRIRDREPNAPADDGRGGRGMPRRRGIEGGCPHQRTEQRVGSNVAAHSERGQAIEPPYHIRRVSRRRGELDRSVQIRLLGRPPGRGTAHLRTRRDELALLVLPPARRTPA